MNAPQSWLQRALGWAITFVVVALLVHWAWDLLRPMLPIVVVIAMFIVVARLVLHHYRRF